MQSRSWDELVAQVKQGANVEEALGLKEPQVNLTPQEFWQKLVVKGVGDTPLSFLPPGPAELLVGVGTPPKEDLVALPPCICLDSLLQPEFVLPPPVEGQEQQEHSEQPGLLEETEPEASEMVTKRKRVQDSSEPESSVEVISDGGEVIDLTQD